MNAAVILKLVDDLSAPARKAHKSLSDLVKDMQKFGKMSFKANGIVRQVSAIEKATQSAKKSVSGLGQAIGKAPKNGFSKSAGSFSGIVKGANQANKAVNTLRSNMAKGATFNGKINSGVSGGSARGIYANRSGSAAGHGFGVGAAAAHVAVYEAMHRAIEKTAHVVSEGFAQVFEKDHTIAMLKMQGEQQSQIDAAIAQSTRMTKELPMFTSAQHLESIAELKPALLGGLEEATKLAPLFQKSVAVLEAVKTGGQHKAMEGIDTKGEALDIVRAVELKGVMKDGDDAIHSYVNSMTKAIVAFNGQIKASDFHAAIKMAGVSARPWSEDFMTQYLPTIINDLKSKGGSGQLAGTALMSMYRAVVDNVMTAKAAAQWDALGAYSPDAFVKKKDGSKDYTKLKPGEHMKGYDVFQQNPVKFMDDFLLKWIKEKNGGVTPPENEAIAKLSGLFGNRVAARVASIMMVQRQQLEKDAENVRKASGLDGLDFLMGADSVMRMQVFAAAFKELGGSLAEVGKSAVIRSMKGLIDFAHRATDAVKASPYAKVLEGHLNAAAAGFFGQERTSAMKTGRDKQYYDAAQFMGEGFSKWISSLGNLFKSLEEIGALTGMMEGLGAVFTTVAAAADTVAAAMQGLANIVNSIFPSANTLHRLNPLGENGILGGENKYKRWQREREGLPAPVAPPVPFAGRYGANKKAPSLWGSSTPAMANPFGGLDTAPKGGFGLGGVQNMGTSALAPIASSANSIVPMMAQAGSNAMSALTGSVAAGAAQVEAQITTLMSTLAAIASQGIRIPITADTSGVAGAIANSVAAGSRGPTNITLHQHINGARDPKAVAGAVHAEFRGAVDKHLSDIG